MQQITGVESGADYNSPNDAMWRAAASQGTYIFIDDKWAESEWLFIDLLDYNIITVKENYITQIINMSRSDTDSKYDISSTTTFDIQKGDVKTRDVKTWYGGKRQEKYRELSVTETTQKYKDNKPSGNATTKKYKTEEIIK